MADTDERRTDTGERILDEAQRLIQTQGYSAFSYQDIADALGVRKASLHYHFATKAALGIAVVERYKTRFDAALRAIGESPRASAGTMLEHYFAPYLEFGKSDDMVCLCGALAGEVLALPEALRERVSAFFEAHQLWLAQILERGQASGEFLLACPPRRFARLMFGALQGALLVKRATGDASQLRDVISALRAQLKAD